MLQCKLTFFQKCKDNNLIPKGFQRHFGLTSKVNDDTFVELIQKECIRQASRMFDIFIDNLEDCLERHRIYINNEKQEKVMQNRYFNKFKLIQRYATTYKMDKTKLSKGRS